MRKLLFILLILLTRGGVFAQNKVYNVPVHIEIPARDRIINDAHNCDKSDYEDYSASDYIKIVDSLMLERRNNKIEVVLAFDTITNNNSQLQEIKFTFTSDVAFEKKVSDFPSGVYVIDSSKVSLQLSEVVKETLVNSIQQHASDSDTILIRIRGTADAVSVKGIRYKNELGPVISGKYFFENTINEVIINNDDYITTNRELAFLRSYSIRNYLENSIPYTERSNICFEHYVEVYENVGKEYRNAKIELIIRRKIRT